MAEPEPPPLDAERILRGLSHHEVDYVLIGGLAVQTHGHVRTTNDANLIPAPQPANLNRLAAALRALGARVLDPGHEGVEIDAGLLPRATMLMVIDTSALVALLLDEPERGGFAAAIEADPRRLVSAATLVEAGIVLEARLGRPGADALDLLLQRVAIQIAAVDREQAEIARRAWRRFGKGNDRAGLNLGDCFAYALAVATAEPLLFKGEDFERTNIPPAVHVSCP